MAKFQSDVLYQETKFDSYKYSGEMLGSNSLAREASIPAFAKLQWHLLLQLVQQLHLLQIHFFPSSQASWQSWTTGSAQCKMEVRIWSGKTHISKWPKSGCNWWNMINIVHIYAKQCEIMQKNQWKGSNGQIHCFCKGNQLRGAKNLEN